MTAVRVAMTPIGGANWLGGRNYQLNLLNAIAAHESGRVEPVVFCGDDFPDEEGNQFSAIRGVEVVRSPAFARRLTYPRLLEAATLGLDSRAAATFGQQGISVVFESATYYGWRMPLPTVAWFPDLQHRRMPDLFGVGSYWKRELGFRAQVASGRILMLSSEAARSDCERYYPGATGRTAVVRFAAPIDPALIVDDPSAVLARYGLRSPFVLLPNQFWRHKNHGIVIEALALLRDKGLDVTVAASGNTSDLRHPDYFATLLARVEALRLGDRFRVLGVIPRSDLISLMRTCSFLMNPSLFEGWSSTVEEARTLGVPLLLSDIPVHREQMGSEANYFSAEDTRDLAIQLERTLASCPAPATARLPVAGAFEPVRRFAADFATVAEKAASGWRGSAPEFARPSDR